MPLVLGCKSMAGPQTQDDEGCQGASSVEDPDVEYLIQQERLHLSLAAAAKRLRLKKQKTGRPTGGGKVETRRQ